MSQDIHVLVVVGPTGIGKSQWALEEAKRTGGTIINADSQQCYSACPTLTAYPSLEDRQTVPHVGYGVLQPFEQTNVGWWLQNVATYIPQVDHPIVVGGTGLYIHALLNGLSDIPPIEKATLDAVDQAMNRNDWLTWARSIDPTLPPTMCDPQRIQRALAVLWQTGKSITTYWKERRYVIPSLKARVVVMDMPLTDLNMRLEKRLDMMLKLGAVEEVREFENSEPHTYKGIQSILGFQELLHSVRGELTLDEARASILLRTRQYAKRQRTWFRQQIKENQCVKVVKPSF